MNDQTETIRDQFWRGIPEPVQAWAALTREGNLMPFSVRERPEDVRLACGECVPVRVLITYVVEPNGRETETTVLLETRAERIERVMNALTQPVPSTKGMGPKDRADRLHAELARRIALAKESLSYVQER